MNILWPKYKLPVDNKCQKMRKKTAAIFSYVDFCLLAQENFQQHSFLELASGRKHPYRISKKDVFALRKFIS